ncbi:magnesium transporter MRS2-3 isoform X2 [Hevea brasiliensis]|uniref:magnesium transporter MRS2-3 isoform X2 n=1 Tax=Hevea brasiliensis TaxID=3981 RepID=UPI0025D4A062|nr:magnesium transporter MRS2-3 isoform X2 [Hevea brasiliensis]
MRDSDPATALNTAPVLRKKGTGVRTWLMLDSTGQNQVLEAGKYSIMRRTGLPARDLRVLDPFLSYPSTVLGRERAIVINLEHIKAIIMAKEVLVLNSEDPFVKPFVQELERRILCYLQATKTQDDGEEDSKQSELVRPEKLLEDFFEDKGSMAERKQGFKNQDGSKVLPFEFVALEACLEAACSILENEANTLELEAHPALDKLTSHISTLNLERVRQIKSRIVATTGRVQRVRDELEHLLDDDGDMAEMYLTNKLFQRHLEPSSTSSTNEGDESDYEDAGVDDRMVPSEILLEAHGDNGSHGTYANSNIRDFNVGELEMLLEAYFVQTDGTLNKLSTVRGRGTRTDPLYLNS